MFSKAKSGVFQVGVLAGLILAAGGMSSAAQAQLVQTINYANFNSTAGLTLNGAAVQSDGVSMGDPKTISITPPTRAVAGSFYSTDRQRVDLGFTTDFKFRIRDRAGVGSDGLTFIIQNQGLNALGDTGGGIGFGTNLAFSPLPTGIINSLAVVFDVWDNSANWPTIPGANVLTVQNSRFGPLAANTPSSLDSVGSTPISGAFNDGAIHQVRITYTPGVLDVYYDVLSTPVLRVTNIFLTNSLNLANGENAFVGFTGATGALVNVQRHEILDWQFSSMIPAPGAAALLGLGGLALARRRRAA